MIEEIIIAIRTFMEAGGDVLYLIAATTFSCGQSFLNVLCLCQASTSVT